VFHCFGQIRSVRFTQSLPFERKHKFLARASQATACVFPRGMVKLGTLECALGLGWAVPFWRRFND